MNQPLARFLAVAFVAAAATAVVAKDAAVANDVIAGTLVDQYGHPLASWHVWGFPTPRWAPNGNGGWTDAQGRFRIYANPRVLHRISVGPSGNWGGPPITDAIHAGVADMTLVVTPEHTPRARVRCRLAAPDGTILRHAEASLWIPEGLASAAFDFDATTGEGVSWRIAPGSYELLANDPVCGSFDFGPCEVKDAGDVDLGTLAFPKPGAVRIDPTAVGAPSGSPVRYMITRPFGDMSRSVSDVSCADLCTGYWARTFEFPGRGELAPGATVVGALLPGDYLLRADGCGTQSMERAFVVRTGETVDVRVPLRVAPLRRIRLRLPGVLPTHVCLSIREADGQVTFHQVVAEAAYVHAYLVAGKHRLEAEADDLRRFTGDLVVPDVGDEPITAPMTLAPDAQPAPR